MAESNEFTCPDGHKFHAIAKLRARCNQCGKMSRRDFVAKTSSPVPTPSTSTVSSHKVVTRKTTARGLKPDSTTIKVDSPDSPKDDLSVKPESTPRKKLEVVRQGMRRPVPKTVAKTTTNIPKTIGRGPVKRVTARRGHTPTVTKPPRGSKERKVIQQTTDEPFWVKVKRQYFG